MTKRRQMAFKHFLATRVSADEVRAGLRLHIMLQRYGREAVVLWLRVRALDIGWGDIGQARAHDLIDEALITSRRYMEALEAGKTGVCGVPPSAEQIAAWEAAFAEWQALTPAEKLERLSRNYDPPLTEEEKHRMFDRTIAACQDAP
ncbi:MAG: hypothetical protein ABSC08_17030 [Bryobacteraceae bacterium]|jgi:hypothetical protein